MAKAAWRLWSIHVRRQNADFRDMASCFTCQRRFKWKELDSGHYKHTSKRKELRTWDLDYNPKNIHPQCTFCNRMVHGNLAVYSLRLEEEYGHGILQQLQEAYNNKRQLTNQELKEIITRYGN